MILTARHLKKSYRYPTPLSILSDINLSLRQGESLAICGRSGEGKTTLLHILGTLEKPDEGTLEIEGQRVTPKNILAIRTHAVGFIFQSFHLFEDFTAHENVLMPARIARRAIPKNYGISLLEQVGLAHRAHFPVKLLSGGEKQRLAIARALCNNPSLILADEPSGNLDTANSTAIGTLLFSLVHHHKKSLILATHDTHLASQCNQTLILQSGSLTPSHN